MHALASPVHSYTQTNILCFQSFVMQRKQDLKRLFSIIDQCKHDICLSKKQKYIRNKSMEKKALSTL